MGRSCSIISIIILMIPENMEEEGLEYPEHDLDQMLDDELEVINDKWSLKII